MKITKQDYESLEMGTVPINNAKEYLVWYISLSDKNKRKITGDNRERFKNKFGKPDWYYKGEFYYHVWVKEYEGETFLILTAKGKGTVIEMVRPNFRGVDSKIDIIKDFIKNIVL